MNEIGRSVFGALGTMQVMWQAVWLLIESHPDGRRFAEKLERELDAWVMRLDVPATPEAEEVHRGYLAAVAEIRSAAQRLKDRDQTA